MGFNLENSEFKSENVKVLIGKQNKYGEETVERKKKQKNKKPKKVVTTEKAKFVDIEKIQQFDKLKIMPPTNITQLDETIKQLEEKKVFFLGKREEEKKTFDTKGPAEENEEKEKEEKPKATKNQAHKKI